ncbi:hypothetical protein R3P38DRAFT_2770789 [Favolaschia claudopus]|uniref:Zn(2)-C6 fungal-type domain-containing protein n=1 Tax=Favolaschia claudopus TaxID=2862362 RepID=A0AAW0CI72_9AGAR
MASSSSSSAMNLFTKRRRAYVACSNCRLKKVKCVRTSEVEYTPCTRCAIKGAKCEYFAVPDDDVDSPPGTPQPPAINLPTSYGRGHGDEAWGQQTITPPSAGIHDFLGGSASSARGKGIRQSSAPRYPYQPRNAPASSSSAGKPRPQQTPQQQQEPCSYIASGTPAFPDSGQYYPPPSSGMGMNQQSPYYHQSQHGGQPAYGSYPQQYDPAYNMLPQQPMQAEAGTLGYPSWPQPL